MARLTKDEEITRRTYNQLASIWASQHRTGDFWLPELEYFCTLLPSGKVLEVGVGGGRDAKELIARGYKYTGTDVSQELVKLAKKNNPAANFHTRSVYELNFKDPFDGFWCVAMLIHVPRKRINEALHSIKRSVRPGAIGFISIKEGMGEELERKIDLDGDGRLFTYYQRDEFQDILSTDGFEIIKHGYKPHSERSKWLTYHVRRL